MASAVFVAVFLYVYLNYGIDIRPSAIETQVGDVIINATPQEVPYIKTGWETYKFSSTVASFISFIFIVASLLTRQILFISLLFITLGMYIILSGISIGVIFLMAGVLIVMFSARS
jgi:hypothetical protein